MSRKTTDKYKLNISTIPVQSGVYLHKNSSGNVIYVGKAKNLRVRVKSYFQNNPDHPPRLQLLLKNIADTDFITTNSETEALILENQLIKEYRPKYNVQLKDDKQYPYIMISMGDRFPRIEVVREIDSRNNRYFGPYTSSYAMQKTLKHILKIFKIRTCKLNLESECNERPCLDYQIGRCSAPCAGFDDEEEYALRINELIKFLEGSNKSIITDLEQTMQSHSDNKCFEEAAAIRDKLAMVKKTVNSYNTITGLTGSVDACGVAHDGKNVCGVVLRIRDGKVLTSHHFFLTNNLDYGKPQILAHLIREYYSRTKDYPSHISLSENIEDSELWSTYLSSLAGHKVSINRGGRGARKDAVEMATSNAIWRLNKFLTNSTAEKNIRPGRVHDLQAALGLNFVPSTIECFDISNFQGKETVASLVYFRDGKPLKKRYRKFKIKTVTGIDDFASIGEVVFRYYSRLMDNDLKPADLVIIDGGKGQVSSAREALTKLGLHNIELIGLAKRNEEIIRENLPAIMLPKSSLALQLIQQVRDEAHRFAITYHRQLRSKNVNASELDNIVGIGQVKKISLLHHFDSVKNIRKATAEQLAEVRGLNKSDVQKVMEYFQNG